MISFSANRLSTRLSFTSRLTLVLALLLLGFGATVALIGRNVAVQHEQESLQRLSHGLARHIVEHWPEITAVDRDAADRAAREALLSKLMVVNPGVQVYVLDAEGRVEAYIGEPGMVREPQVDLSAVRAFLAGAALPLLGTDPMGSHITRIFSAAMFPPRVGDTRPPGYLYIVLDGRARDQVAGTVSLRRVWIGAASAVVLGLVLTFILGVLLLRHLTRPLQRLAAQIQAYSLGVGEAAAAETPGRAALQTVVISQGDELGAIGSAFEDMKARIQQQTEREREQAAAHREVMAGVAHDLRTPLTALHGHLEALAGERAGGPPGSDPRLGAALAQSDKVRRLSQQLFELAALQSTDQVLHRERFQLEDLVTDTVQKFEWNAAGQAVQLQGPAPGRLELDGDLQLIERALTNLIDNAIRHAPGEQPVRISVDRDGPQARVLIEDAGPGLPADVWQRLDEGRSLRDPPLKRAGGGIGGLGLAIAQRVAVLHGGMLRALPAPQGGTRLCLMLPLLPALQAFPMDAVHSGGSNPVQ